MEKLIESIKGKDLVKAKKNFAELMEGITSDIKVQEQNKIAKSIFVEGEEPAGKEDDDKADSIDDSNASKEDEDETATA